MIRTQITSASLAIAMLALATSGLAQEPGGDCADPAAVRTELMTTQIPADTLDRISGPLSCAWRPSLSDDPRPAYRLVTFPVLRRTVEIHTLHWTEAGWKVTRESVGQGRPPVRSAEDVRFSPRTRIINAMHRLTACEAAQVPAPDAIWLNAPGEPPIRRSVPGLDGYAYVVFMTWDGEQLCAHEEPNWNDAALDIVKAFDSASRPSR